MASRQRANVSSRRFDGNRLISFRLVGVGSRAPSRLPLALQGQRCLGATLVCGVAQSRHLERLIVEHQRPVVVGLPASSRNVLSGHQALGTIGIVRDLLGLFCELSSQSRVVLFDRVALFHLLGLSGVRRVRGQLRRVGSNRLRPQEHASGHQRRRHQPRVAAAHESTSCLAARLRLGKCYARLLGGGFREYSRGGSRV